MDSMTLRILNSQTGDSQISFDCDDKDSVAKAEEQITDLLKLGYAIFVKNEKGEETRITKFSKKTCTYYIGSKEIPAKKTEATVVAPTSGGCAVIV